MGVNLANDGKGPVPFFYHSADGSANGHIAVAKNLQHLLKYLKPKRLLMVTDRGCFSAEHAIRMVRVHHFDRKLTLSEILSLPPRRRGLRKPTLKFSYRYHPELASKDAQYDGFYVIGTSLSEKTHSTDEVFIAFKEQHHIETAHHQWKAPIRPRPLFLKKVTRIESLVFVQFLALMAFYLLQRLYRLSKGKTCRTTGEPLLRGFAFSAIAVRYKKDTVRVTPLPLKPAQADVLERLKFPFISEQIRSYVTRPKSSAEHDKGRGI